MEAGFLPYHEDAVARDVRWYPGEIEHYGMFGIQSGYAKTDSAKYRNVVSYRCPKCGLLRSYAK